LDFPHLRRDTKFPDLQTVDVYEFQNTFDYTRWNEFTKVRLVNVIWNSDYSDVVKFDTNAERDAWFDSIEDYFEIDLQQACRVVPEGFIKLPIPYDVMARYNYLYVDMPIATDANHPIDFETTNGIRRWYFFIDTISYRAPNTTEVRVIPDVWMNFQNDVDINYMVLDRGHAPVAYSDVDEYLANPIANNQYLLAPDVNYGSDTIVRNADYMPFGDGEKWLVFLSTISPSDIVNIGSVSGWSSDSWTNPTYSNTGDRYGYQLQVNGYNFGDAGDYSGLSVPASNGGKDRLPNGVYAYATDAQYCFGDGNAIQGMMSRIPNFLRSVLACVVVPLDMISFIGDLIEVAGYRFYPCIGRESTAQNIELSKDMFDFPEEYQRFAKLYTFPYSSIELTDNDGRKVDVKIENTSGMHARAITSLAFPFLNMRVFFDGINGVGSESYTWQRINGSSVSKSMPNGDWYENCFDWDIPTYAVYMSGKIAYNLNNYNSMQNARRDALVGYHTSVRGTNTAMQNSIDSENTGYTNVDASATTMVTNMANTINTQIANNNAATACNTANTNSANSHGQTIMSNNNSQITSDNSSTNNCIDSTTVVENQTSIACAASTNLANINASAVNGGLGGIGMAAGALAAGATGPVGAAIVVGGSAALGAMTAATTGAANGSNSMLVAQCNASVAGATMSRNTSLAIHAEVANAANQYEMNADRSTQTSNTNNCMNTQTTNTTNCERTNTNNDATTMRANADRTRDTANANSGYTREVAILNAKEILENAQASARSRYKDSGNAAPIQIGSYTGSMSPDYYETRGIQIKVRTQSDSAIRQAGDMFARFGYALNQVWNVAESGLKLMKHFTYWKASDIWVDDRSSSNNAVNSAIETMFLKGVTVWSNPDEIGRVSIYAN